MDENQNYDFWNEVIARLAETVSGWMLPGQAVSLFNNTDNPIFVRTYNQSDNFRLIPYGSWTINPRSFSIISARGVTNIQVDIRGRIFRSPIGIPQAYTAIA